MMEGTREWMEWKSKGEERQKGGQGKEKRDKGSEKGAGEGCREG